MGSPCLFTCQHYLKLGYFYWLSIKNSNPILTELSLCFLKQTNFYLEHKVSLIQISSIASFKDGAQYCYCAHFLWATVHAGHAEWFWLL